MPTVSDDILFKIKEANDIIDVISSRMRLQKAGKNYTGLCPFHAEKSPSFSVNPDKQFFHCFGCGAGGDVFTFLVKYENISFIDAVKKLADRGGIALPKTESHIDKKTAELKDKLFAINSDSADFFASNLNTTFGASCLDYLKKRGLTKESIDKFRVGCAPDSWDSLLSRLKSKGHPEELIEKAGLIVKKEGHSSYYDRFRNRIIFPIFSTGGNIIGFGGRVLDDSLPKYLNSPETPVFSKGDNLYALNLAKEAARQLGYLIIVEGYLDTITPHQYGINNVVATLGTALTESHIQLIKRYTKKVVLIFDPDTAGVKAVLRGLELFLKTDIKVNVVALPEKLDPDNFVKKYGKDAFLKELKQSVKILDFFINYTISNTTINSIDDKISIVNETLPKISMVKNRIERDYFIKKLSEKLSIDEKLLRQELVKDAESSPQKSRYERDSLPSSLRSPILNDEETLLKVIISSEKLAERANEIINIDDITNGAIKKIIIKIFKLIESKTAPNIESILKDEDESIKNIISKLIVEQSLSTTEDFERAFSESIFMIQKNSIDRKLNEIQALIVNATNEKNEKLKEELLQEYGKINKIKKELKKHKG